jgi:Uma2 family endonuclease
MTGGRQQLAADRAGTGAPASSADSVAPGRPVQFPVELLTWFSRMLEAPTSMSVSPSRPVRPEVVYPDSDGEPMSDNTLQFEWIVTIKEGLEAVFKDDPNVFVAGDLLWYPVEGDPTTRMAPDALVAIGRPKGYRGSYRQWEEAGIAPQAVFEVLSPGNRAGEMARKLRFYDRFGVEEYYIYDPDDNTLEGYLREGGSLRKLPDVHCWTSPRLGVRFELTPDSLRLTGPDNRPFLSYVDLVRQRDAIEQERDALARERDAERQRAERLAARLRELGIEPES